MTIQTFMKIPSFNPVSYTSTTLTCKNFLTNQMSVLQLLTIKISIIAIIESSRIEIHDWYGNGNSKYFDNFTASVVLKEDGDYNVSSWSILNTEFFRGYVRSNLITIFIRSNTSK